MAVAHPPHPTRREPAPAAPHPSRREQEPPPPRRPAPRSSKESDLWIWPLAICLAASLAFFAIEIIHYT